MSFHGMVIGLVFVSVCSAAPVPLQASRVGFLVRTFDARLTAQSVDLQNRMTAEAEWYSYGFFATPRPTGAAVAFHTDGSLTLGDAVEDVSLATAAPAKTAAGWVGRAFGGGGYFEATLAFDPDKTISAHGKAWPAFWSLPIEHAVSIASEQWLGQPPGYVHFIEPDFFEYDVWSFRSHRSYGGAIHDWYGKFRETCPGQSFCSVSNTAGFVIDTPANTDFRTSHRFGMLWVPATRTTSGYVRYYFDGTATSDEVRWSLYDDQVPPPGKAPWTFGILDRQHLVLIIGTGANQPMTVSAVSVWQSSTSGNLEFPAKGTTHR